MRTCACRLVLGGGATGCRDDDVTAVAMATLVGVACFVGGALTGAIAAAAGGVICQHQRRHPNYFLSRRRRSTTPRTPNVYAETPTSTGARLPLPLVPLPSPDSSADTEDVFSTLARRQLTMSDACLQRHLMLRSTESFRSMRTKLDSVDDDDDARVM